MRSRKTHLYEILLYSTLLHSTVLPLAQAVSFFTGPEVQTLKASQNQRISCKGKGYSERTV